MLSGHRRVRLSGTPLAALRRVIIGAATLRHNGTPVLDYPESEWDLVAFPAQKGGPYVADNLATVNDYSFLHDARFAAAHVAAMGRWKPGARDIRWRLHTFLWALETCLRLHEHGALVELGTGNGYMAAGACAYLDWGFGGLTAGRELWLFDSFEATRRDEVAVPGAKRFFYADGDAEVRAHFARYPGVQVVTGWLPETLSALPSDSICFVHVDLNHAGSEVASLEVLGPRLAPGAFVLFDDSGNPGCTEQLAAHLRWARERSAPFLQLPSGQALCILPGQGRGALHG